MSDAGARASSRYSSEPALHRGGVDVRTTADDRQLLALTHEQVPGVVQDTDVARVQFLRLEALHRRVLPVSEHRCVLTRPRALPGGSNDDLPHLPGGQLAPVVVADAHVQVR